MKSRNRLISALASVTGAVICLAPSPAVRLVLKLSDGTRAEVATRLAPPGLRKRFPFSSGLRFYDQFFPDELAPELVVAYDRGGRLIGYLRFGGYAP